MSTCTVDGCGNQSKSRGWCSKHYERWRQHGNPGAYYPNRRSSSDRFWSKVDKGGSNGCWLWTGAKSPKGYGLFTPEKPGPTFSAHRYAWGLFGREMPPRGIHLDHLCRVRNCVNPDHLEPVTNWENQLRSPLSVSAANARKTHCINGHEFSTDNTILYHGNRVCRQCGRDRARAWKLSRRGVSA